jgi:hypothetical protein
MHLPVSWATTEASTQLSSGRREMNLNPKRSRRDGGSWGTRQSWTCCQHRGTSRPYYVGCADSAFGQSTAPSFYSAQSGARAHKTRNIAQNNRLFRSAKPLWFCRHRQTARTDDCRSTRELVGMSASPDAIRITFYRFFATPVRRRFRRPIKRILQNIFRITSGEPKNSAAFV